jgi:rhodanese-related sulfurtransferase
MPSDRMSPEEVNARALAGEPIVFIDARNEQAWKNSDQKIPHAIRMTADDVASRAHELDRGATIITYCT